MTDGEEHSRNAELQLWAQHARARSEALVAHAGRAAESAAAGKDHADRMIERLAEHNPQHAEQLYAVLSTAAGQRAAIAARKDHLHAAGRGDSQLVPGQQDGPEAAAFTALDSYLHDAAAVQERERIAGQLLDNVIRRVSALGLTLAGAAGLTMAPEARKRIEEAADGLDDVIRAIRGVVFNQQYPMS